MKCSCVSLLILIILINLTTGSENQVRRRLVPQVRQHQACTLVNRITLYENHSSTEDWLCELQDEDAANAGVRFVGIEGLDAGHLPLVQSGSTTIFVEGATLSQDKLIVPQGTRTEFGESQPLGLERKLAPGDGRRKVLAVWVTARDSNPTLTPQQLSDKIFGTINDSVNLKERMASCSYDELLIEPYVDNNVINGVIQVSLNQNVVSEDHENVRKNVVEAVGTLLGKQLPFAGLQHLMVCLPPGTLKESNPRWAAYGKYEVIVPGTWMSVKPH